MRPVDFARKSKGYFKKLEREHELAWKVARWQTSWLFNVQVEPKHRLKPTDLLWLPSDGEQPAPGPPKVQITPEYIEDVKKRFEALLSGQQN